MPQQRMPAWAGQPIAEIAVGALPQDVGLIPL